MMEEKQQHRSTICVVVLLLLLCGFLNTCLNVITILDIVGNNKQVALVRSKLEYGCTAYG